MSDDPLHHTNVDDLAELRRDGRLAAARLFEQYRPRLERMIEFRLDRRLYGRVDADDILQDAYLEIERRLPDYLANPEANFFIWSRGLVLQSLIAAHRAHFVVHKRSVAREVRFTHDDASASGSAVVALVNRLVGDFTSPSGAVMRDESVQALTSALESMDEIDREVLAMRHFEQLTNAETAAILGLQSTAASNRYIRALERLRYILLSIESGRL